MDDIGSITTALRRLEDGDAKAFDDLLPLVYTRLRSLAGSYFKGGANQTLQPTALVHEAFLRLVTQQAATYDDREHFFAVAATAMRQILVDRVRRRRAAKRGGDRECVTLTGLSDDSSSERVVDVIAVSQALEHLHELNERQARIVDMRLFSGMTVPEIAQVLGVSVSTVEKEWRRARAFLLMELKAA